LITGGVNNFFKRHLPEKSGKNAKHNGKAKMHQAKSGINGLNR
jgi:hypothetical protein